MVWLHLIQDMNIPPHVSHPSVQQLRTTVRHWECPLTLTLPLLQRMDRDDHVEGCLLQIDNPNIQETEGFQISWVLYYSFLATHV